MALLVLTGMRFGANSSFCSFTVSVAGGPARSPDSQLLDQSFFNLADVPSQIEITATHLDSNTVPQRIGTFQLDAANNLLPVSVPPEFQPPTVVATPFSRTIFLNVHFSGLRDVTDHARRALSPTGVDYPDASPAGGMNFRRPFNPPLPPAAYTPLPTVLNHTFIDSPAVAATKIRVVSNNQTPQGEVIVVEWIRASQPHLIAVYWPNSVPRTGPTPYLIYFHPTAGQNTPQFFVDARDRHDPLTNTTYPWGFDYQLFGFWRYLNYFGDPFKIDPFAKGLPYQIEQSGKPSVLVLPLNKAAANSCDEITDFTDADLITEFLNELQGFMFRRAGNYVYPGIGHLAMASFSSGWTLLVCFLSKAANHSHTLYKDVLQEVYLFDPHADDATTTIQPVTHMAAWATSGTSANKVARLYTQHPPGILGPILVALGLAPSLPAFDATQPSNSRRSLTCVPLANWNALSLSVGTSFQYVNTQASHQVIPALLLTDALRRSDF